MSRILPHPVLTLVITAVWILLVNSFSVGAVLLGLVIGILVPMFTAPYWPGRPRVRHPFKILAYLGIVLWDIVVSNVQVAWLVLFRKGDSLRSRFVTIPLELRSPEAITVLAGTITMTPGTVSADLSACGRALLVHCLETDDPEGTVAQIKDRYERRLMEIFE
ncbi:Na+/H+ antiporter subunit E [Salinarimonas ramus]|uniref:Na+/H+ antiporter subunit E n=1 Tax=Salinarimonas ramus TaxID=690164 RepID=A0A917V771_9HYPH|nr:Na+/H+ antiporter subunit E [Salinarimonas ramus]GGK45406.1 Na+/H+ antiporter subunit E [Salinarimonas ramus]